MHGRTSNVGRLRTSQEGHCVGDVLGRTEAAQRNLAQQRGMLLGQIPLGRLGAPEDIAHAVAFLASPQAAYITGSTMHVNGGMYMN